MWWKSVERLSKKCNQVLECLYWIIITISALRWYLSGLYLLTTPRMTDSMFPCFSENTVKIWLLLFNWSDGDPPGPQVFLSTIDGTYFTCVLDSAVWAVHWAVPEMIQRERKHRNFSQVWFGSPRLCLAGRLAGRRRSSKWSEAFLQVLTQAWTGVEPWQC